LSVLSVHDMTSKELNVDSVLVNHNPFRTAQMTGGSGNFTVNETINFATSEATGKVVSWNSGTKVLVYTLTTVKQPKIAGRVYAVMPALGETVTGQSSSATAVLSKESDVGDTFMNDSRTMLFVRSAFASPLYVVPKAAGKCSHGFLHDPPLAVAANFFGPIGPFGRQQFNAPGGLVTVMYVGTNLVASLGVAAVRMFPGE
jgi:hypothetical protein